MAKEEIKTDEETRTDEKIIVTEAPAKAAEAPTDKASSIAKKEKEEPAIKCIEDLPGVGVTTAEKLRGAGFDSLMSVAVMPASQLVELTGLGDAVSKKAITAARNALDMNFITGKDVLKKRSEVGRISTGSVEFDKLIGGGVETQGLTEAFGEFGSGKSQIAMQLAVNVQLPVEQGGQNAQCVFIDTEGTFRPERIRQMAEAKGLDATKVLNNIMVARAYSSDHQMLLAERIGELIAEKKLKIKLVIVDSLMALFRAEYAGRGMLANRQQKLNRHLHTLQRLSDVHNLVVYVTNQVMSKPDIFFGNPTAAIGGHILGHMSNFRLYLRKGKAGKRIARLVDSPHLPEGEAIFKVTANGVEDAV